MKLSRWSQSYRGRSLVGDAGMSRLPTGVVVMGESLQCSRLGSVPSWSIRSVEHLSERAVQRFCAGVRGKNPPAL